MPSVLRQRVQKVVAVLRGPEPIGAAAQHNIDGVTILGLAGGAGTLRWGQPSMGANRFDGPLNPPQSFKGAANIGATPSVKTGAGTGLPNTQQPPGLPPTLQSLLARQDLAQ